MVVFEDLRFSGAKKGVNLFTNLDQVFVMYFIDRDRDMPFIEKALFDLKRSSADHRGIPFEKRGSGSRKRQFD